nr:zinc finger, CCHC-type, retrotransposon Gag domain protein [Tanacetum cinerariifolium]
ERLKREYHFIRQTNTKTSTEFMQRFLRLGGFLGAAAGTTEEQAKNFQWGLRRSTLNHLMCMPFTDVAQIANAARNYEILYERDDDDAKRPDKRQKSGDRHQPTTQQRIPVMGVTREIGVSSPTDLSILVPSSPGVPLRATPTQFALRVDADTQKNVVELLVPASSVVKLAICRRIARRTPL